MKPNAARRAATPTVPQNHATRRAECTPLQRPHMALIRIGRLGGSVRRIPQAGCCAAGGWAAIGVDGSAPAVAERLQAEREGKELDSMQSLAFVIVDDRIVEVWIFVEDPAEVEAFWAGLAD